MLDRRVPVLSAASAPRRSSCLTRCQRAPHGLRRPRCSRPWPRTRAKLSPVGRSSACGATNLGGSPSPARCPSTRTFRPAQTRQAGRQRDVVNAQRWIDGANVPGPAWYRSSNGRPPAPLPDPLFERCGGGPSCRIDAARRVRAEPAGPCAPRAPVPLDGHGAPA